MPLQPSKASPTSSASLVLANITPLFGVLFFHWDVFSIMFLYWLESAIIGGFNVAKIVMATRFQGAASMQDIKGSITSPSALAPFFMVHYGIFMTVHLSFICAFFSPKNSTAGSLIIHTIVQVFFAILSLIVSHGISFYKNFVILGVYKKISVSTLFFAPYKRIFFMHLTIIFGAILILPFGAPVLGLVILVALKTAADLYSHHKIHATLGGVLSAINTLPNDETNPTE